MSYTKFGPDRFSSFEVYWMQTDIQTDKPNLYIKMETGNTFFQNPLTKILFIFQKRFSRRESIKRDVGVCNKGKKLKTNCMTKGE